MQICVSDRSRIADKIYYHKEFWFGFVYAYLYNVASEFTVMCVLGYLQCKK